jgi:hypothetical protein
LERWTGAPVGNAPFVEEALAVGLSQPVRAAEVGLRHLRERSLATRFLDAITGKGAALENSIGNDFVQAQRASVDAVRLLMTDVTRSRACSIRVLANLHQVNEDLDTVMEKQHSTDERVDQLANDFRLLAGNIDEIRQLVVLHARRGAELRRLDARFRARALHPGMGELLGAAFFVTVSLRHTEGDDPKEVRAERLTLLATVEERLGHRVQPSSELFARAVIESRPELAPAVQLVLGGDGPGTRVLRSLVSGTTAANDGKAVARQLDSLRAQDAAGAWAPHLLRPLEFVEHLVDELTAAGIE